MKPASEQNESIDWTRASSPIDVLLRESLRARPDSIPEVDLAQLAIRRAGDSSAVVVKLVWYRRWRAAATCVAAIAAIVLVGVIVSRLGDQSFSSYGSYLSQSGNDSSSSTAVASAVASAAASTSGYSQIEWLILAAILALVGCAIWQMLSAGDEAGFTATPAW